MSSLDIIQPAKDHCAKDDNSVSEWLDNWRQCAEAYQDILNEWVKRNKDTLSLEHLTAFMPIASKYTQLWQESLNDPERLLQAQVAWWQDCLAICQRGREEWFNERSNRPLSLVKVLPSSRDKRFHHEDWQSHPFYNTIRDIYLLTKTHIDDWLHETPVIDEKSRSQLSFFTRQLMDAASPSNCLFTNPELIHLTIENKGANLVRGLQHMLEDLKRNDGFYTIKMTDTDHFQLGNNLATKNFK